MGKAMCTEPYAVQRATVRAHASPALFHKLREKSLEMGRRDRLQGVRLAELAVVSLEGCAKNLGAGIHDYRALGWAWVGRARRLANDHAAADEAFARAEAEWCVPRPSPDPVIEAEILDLKSALRLFQRRFDEALELASRSIDRLRLLDEPRLLARALVGWANIMIYRGDEPTARPCLQEALELVDSCDEPYLVLSAMSALANLHAQLGAHEEAAGVLPKAKALCTQLAFELGWHQLRWIEGLVKKGQGELETAASLFLDAKQGFEGLGELDCVAVITLDLGITYSEQGRASQVVELIQEAMPVFKTFRSYSEGGCGVEDSAQCPGGRGGGAGIIAGSEGSPGAATPRSFRRVPPRLGKSEDRKTTDPLTVSECQP